jgi:VanZ family protein
MISWFEKHNKISLIITIIIAIFIFYISSLTFEAGVPGPEFRFKPIVYHFLVFLLFSFFLLITLTRREKINLFLLAIIISIIYAISDEFHQLFVPGRNFAISDILTDSAGVFFVGLLYSFRIKFKNKINKEEDLNLYY